VYNRLITGGPDPTGWRLPAPKLEAIIARLIADHLTAATTERRLMAAPDLREGEKLIRASQGLLQRLRQKDPDTLRAILTSGSIDPRRITLTLDKAELATALGISPENLAPDLANIHSPVRLRRRGVEAKLVIGDHQPDPDPVLIRTLRDAHLWAGALREGTPLLTIARNTAHHDAFIRTRGQLAFLSPKIQIAIREGTLPLEVTLKRMLRQPIPLDWITQERMFGL
jgi:site-specific DNA recombinase